MIVQCEICRKNIETDQPFTRYCSDCKYKRKLDYQRRRYIKSGIFALKKLLKTDDYFLLGCEVIYKKLAGVKLEDSNKMVEQRVQQLVKILNKIEDEIERLKGLTENEREN